jgi:chromosome segregation ATPase
MLTRSGEVKLVDFATMREDMEAGGMAASIKGTPAYMAPEIWSKGDYEGEKVDVWSMGVILYEMVCGELPWLGKDIKGHLHNVRNDPLKIKPSLGLSKELCELLGHMLKVKAPMRLSWAELMTHDWLMEDPMSANAVGNFLEENVRRLELMVEKLQTRCNVLETAQGQKDTVIRELSKELQQLQDSHDVNRSAGEEVVALRTELEQVQARYEKAATDARVRELELEESHARCAALETRVDKAEKTVQKGDDQRAKQVSQLKEELAASKRSQKALNEKVVMSTKQVVELQERLAAAEEESNLRLMDITAKYDEAQAEVTSMNETWDSLHSELESSRTKLNAAESAVVDLERECSAVEQQLRDTNGKLEAVSQGWNEMDRDLTKAKGVADAALVRVNELDAEKRSLIEQRDSLQRMVDDVLGNLTKSGDGETRQQLEELGKEVIRLNEVLQEKDKEMEALNNELASLNLVIKQGFHMLNE